MVKHADGLREGKYEKGLQLAARAGNREGLASSTRKHEYFFAPSSCHVDWFAFTLQHANNLKVGAYEGES